MIVKGEEVVRRGFVFFRNKEGCNNNKLLLFNEYLLSGRFCVRNLYLLFLVITIIRRYFCFYFEDEECEI